MVKAIMEAQMTFEGLKYYVEDPRRLVSFFASRGMLNWLSDDLYIHIVFKLYIGKKLNLKTPRSFNEKLQWLKMYDRNPYHTKLADKKEVKGIVADIIGAEYIIPTLQYWKKSEDINFDYLPNQFVIKCNHNSGTGMFICKDKAKLTEEDIKKIRKDLDEGLNENYFIKNREWPYKDIPRYIIAEQYLEDTETKELRDYKFFCFNGKVKMFKVDYNRFVKHGANYYDLDGHLLPFGEVICPPDPNVEVEIPSKIGEMISLAEKLANGMTFVRVDFYYVNNKIYFGEMTFFPSSGFGRFIPEQWDDIIGQWLELPTTGVLK